MWPIIYSEKNVLRKLQTQCSSNGFKLKIDYSEHMSIKSKKILRIQIYIFCLSLEPIERK